MQRIALRSPLRKFSAHGANASSVVSCEKLESGRFDVIVVGGGHAGVEASCASARMGAKTLLITQKIDAIGEMSCNPSFGGIGKGHLMREIDALDGVSPKICDMAGINFRVLNRSKGCAVWGLRAQIDRDLYKRYMHQEVLHYSPKLMLSEASVNDLLCERDRQGKWLVAGVVLGKSVRVFAKSVILTTGTFLKAKINVGLESWSAGRMGEDASVLLADTLARLGFALSRLKTGTPPRLESNSIDFSKLDYVESDADVVPFSYMNKDVAIERHHHLPTYVTSTSESSREIVLKNLHLSSHIKEEINGPRYCPSIESKFQKFKALSHIVWLESEGLNSDMIYPQGLTTTLPQDLQVKLVRSCPGLEEANLVRFGYGVEYDFINPTQVNRTLETKKLQNLFLAGQINGTTGYEEAASQGIVAGINGACQALNKEEFVIDRTEAYIGVLIDDLTTHGITEPYRMFTSRNEFRFHHRPDNADTRLTKKGFKVGCVSQHRYDSFLKCWHKLEEVVHRLRNQAIDAQALINAPRKYSAFKLLASNVIQFSYLFDKYPELYGDVDKLLAYKATSEALYFSIMLQMKEKIKEVKQENELIIPSSIDYSNPKLNLSNEIKERLGQIRPNSIGAAYNLPGMTFDAITRLIIHIKCDFPN